MTTPQQEGWLVGNDLGTNSELLYSHQYRFRHSGRVRLLSLDQHFSPQSELLGISKSANVIIIITGQIIIDMIADLVVTVIPAGLVLSNSVSSTVRHVGVESGQPPPVPPAVGPHHGAVRQQRLSPELTAWEENIAERFPPSSQLTWSARELEESVGALISLYVVGWGVDQSLGNTRDNCEGDDLDDCAPPD